MSCRNVDQTTGLFVSGVQELSTIFLSPSSQKKQPRLWNHLPVSLRRPHDSVSDFPLPVTSSSSSSLAFSCLQLPLFLLPAQNLPLSQILPTIDSGSPPSTQDGLLPLLFLVMARRSVSVVRRISDVIPRQAQLVDWDA